MAFNWQTFKTRALTAILFVIVMAAGFFINIWSFLILFSVIHFGCWWEYFRIMEKIHNVKFHPYVKLGLMVLGYGLMLWFCGPAFSLYGYGLKENISLPVSLAGFVLMILGIFQKVKIDLRSFIGAGVGLVYISFSWGLMIDLRSGYHWYPEGYLQYLVQNLVANDFGIWAVLTFLGKNFLFCLTIILTMWINDTMAYIVGSLIGKTPLSSISPKKTWEGTIGGIILGIIVTGLLSFNVTRDLLSPEDLQSTPRYFWFGLAAVGAIAGTFGDLLESKLKRMANIKDSGHIMPGHGGFLDRFDSLILAIPFCWLYIFVFQSLYSQ